MPYDDAMFRLLLCLTLLLTLMLPAFAADPAPADNAELTQLYTDDQGDREALAAGTMEWEAIALRDDARLARALELIEAGALHTGADYYHAAMVLQHSGRPALFLLGHELCVIAISKGNADAKWLAAASLDRYLNSIGRPQRWGTQRTKRFDEAEYKLVEVEPGVSDAMRAQLDVPPLDTTLEQTPASSPINFDPDSATPEVRALFEAATNDHPQDFETGQWLPAAAGAATRDAQRAAQVRELFAGGGLANLTDHFFAGAVLQYSTDPADLHLAVAILLPAVAHGIDPAKYVAARIVDKLAALQGEPPVYGADQATPRSGVSEEARKALRVSD
jgi:hypothetical protein